MIFVSCLIKPISTHLRFTQAFSFMSYYPPKNVDFQCERCHVLFSTKGCFTRESLCEGEQYWHQQNGSKAWECNIFFLKCSKKYITIWFCMLLEDMMQVLPLLMPQVFVDQLVFIWRCKKCTRMLDQFIIGTYYYL